MSHRKVPRKNVKRPKRYQIEYLLPNSFYLMTFFLSTTQLCDNQYNTIFCFRSNEIKRKGFLPKTEKFNRSFCRRVLGISTLHKGTRVSMCVVNIFCVPSVKPFFQNEGAGIGLSLIFLVENEMRS